MKANQPLTDTIEIHDRNGKKIGEKEVASYAGLLAKAHDEGLRAITTEIVQAPTSANGEVAIVRATKKDLPFTFRLDDSNSPMPARKLSEVGTVVIVARLSKSGEAMPKSGDLQGTSQPVKPGIDGITT